MSVVSYIFELILKLIKLIKINITETELNCQN